MSQKTRKVNVHRGFPSPSRDFKTDCLSLDDIFVKHPSSTFYFRFVGGGFKKSGITSGDILMIDRSLDMLNNDLIIVELDGELLLRRYNKNMDLITLSTDYDYIKRGVGLEGFVLWGVVTVVVKSLRYYRDFKGIYVCNN